MSGLASMRQNSTWPDLVWKFYDENGNLQILPVGTIFTLYIYDPNNPADKTTGQGTWDTTNIAGGSVTYKKNIADTATKGNFKAYAWFVRPDSETGASYDEDWIVY